MPIPNNFTALISALQEDFEDNGTEFTSYLPTSIRLAEKRINRDLDTLGTKFQTSVAVTPSVESVTKPTGHRLTYDIFIRTSTGERKYLRKVTDDYLRYYWPDVTETATPVYYAERDRDTILLAPVPNDSYTLSWSYQKDIEYLTSSNQTNYITSAYSDALYYATMVEQARFARTPTLLQEGERRYQETIDRINNGGRRQRADDNSLPYSPEINQNTLNKTE